MSAHYYQQHARKRFLGDMVVTDFFDLLCGDFIGSGICRSVHRANAGQMGGAFKGCVVKIEVSAGDYFQNVLEFNVWQAVRYTKLARWFAPCVAISPCGKVLIQKETKEVSLDRYPKKIPGFFTDEKWDNWGLYKGRVVCHDYGVNLMLEEGMDAKLNKAKWRL